MTSEVKQLIWGIGNAASAYTGQEYGRTGTASYNELGRDVFLQLLVTQLRYQNPLNPVEDRAFLAELAQFSMLERIQELRMVVSAAQQLQGIGMLGKRVVLHNGVEGLVTAVSMGKDGPSLQLDNGERASLSDVAHVSLTMPQPVDPEPGTGDQEDPGVETL